MKYLNLFTNKKPNSIKTIVKDNSEPDNIKSTILSEKPANFLLQIRQGIQLKKLDALERKPIKIHNPDQNFIAISLSQAIKKRYENLNKDNQNSEDEF